MRHLRSIGIALALLSTTSIAAQDANLVQTLVKQTGVTEKQASGGAGLVLDYAKKQMSPGDFSQLTTSVPEFGPLATQGAKLAPPKPTGATGAAAGAASGITGAMGLGGGLSSLGGAFKALGMSPEMVTKFVPILLDYAKGKGGAGAFGLLSKALK
jgi:hypothetical protein